MRKVFCLILLLALLLSGCAANVPEESAAPSTAPDAPESTASVSVLVPGGYSDADTAAMSSYMSANRWLIDGDRLYGLDYDEALRPALVSCRLRGGKLTERKILCEDCVPSYLALEGKTLYFLCGGELRRCDLKSGKCETLLSGGLQSLQLFDGALYYTDATGRYYSADLDGQNAELLIEGPCGYAWAMPEGVLYQSEREGCCLRMRLWDGAERRLSAAASYAPLRIGSLVWYSQRDSEGSVLASIDLNDGTVTRCATGELRGAAELIPGSEGWMLRVFLAGEGWRQQLLRPGETAGTDCAYSGYRFCDYVGEDCRIDAAYDPDGRLRCFVLADREGNELRFFGGELLE